ncbi:MAG: hypothetical protein V3V02_08190 [Rhizobiaceae bacterium]
MLFRNFMLVTASIAMLGVALLNVIESTHPENSGFQVGQRLKEWKLHEEKQACKADPKTCSIKKLQNVA